MKNRHILLLLFLAVFSLPAIAQNETIDIEKFNHRLFSEEFYHSINKYRLEKKLDSLIASSVLEAASADQAKAISEEKQITLEQSGSKKTTRDRISYYGGSGNGAEFVFKLPAKGTYNKLAEEILSKLLSGKNSEEILNDNYYKFIGIGSWIGKTDKKAYFSIVFAGPELTNDGAEKMQQMLKNFKEIKLKNFDEQECKSCENFKHLNDIQKSLFARNDSIFVKYNDIKIIEKLIKESSDGLAVDVIRKNQFPCHEKNIIDYNLNHKGILLKPVYANELFGNNISSKQNNIPVFLGKLPEGAGQDDELKKIIYLYDNHFSHQYVETCIIKIKSMVLLN